MKGSSEKADSHFSIICDKCAISDSPDSKKQELEMPGCLTKQDQHS